MGLGVKTAESNYLKWVAMAAPIGVVLAVLFFFAPDQYPFYPRCLLHTLTGWQCPGCGGLRAMHHLLHGHISSAFHYNPLLVLLLPALAVILAWHRVRQGRGQVDPLKHPCWIWLLVTIVVVFGIARNFSASF